MACEEMTDLLQQLLVAAAAYEDASTEELPLAVNESLTALDEHSRTHQCGIRGKDRLKAIAFDRG